MPTPAHYKIICISIYTDDLKALDAKVDVLKTKGVRGVSRSSLIRLALSRLPVGEVGTARLTHRPTEEDPGAVEP